MLKGTLRQENTWLQSSLAIDTPPPDGQTDAGGDDIDPRFWWWDLDTGHIWNQQPSDGEDDQPPQWVDEGAPMPPGSVPPGDGLPPDEPTSFVVTASYFEHDDGTNEPILVAAWKDPTAPDVIGFELQWDTAPYDTDGTTVLPPDWLNYQSMRTGVVGPGLDNLAQLTPVIGGNWYGARVRAYDIDGLHSDWVEAALVQAAPDDSAPDIPENVDAVGGYRLIGVTWDASSSPDIAFYEYHYRVVGDTEWGQPFKAKSNRVIIDNLEDVTEYEVQCRAIDRSGNVRVSGNPQADPPDEVIDNYSNKDVGWSEPPVTATTSLIGVESVAFKKVVSDFITSGQITADQIVGGELLLGRPGHEGTIRIYDSDGNPIGAWGDFGWVIADPRNPSRAVHADAGFIRFTNQFQMQTSPGVYEPWDGTDDLTQDKAEFLDPPTNEVPNPNYLMWDVTRGIESGINGTTWTTAIDWRGVNAEAITFGSQFGGNNRLLNAGFELQDFDTATLVTKEYTDAVDFGTAKAGSINMKLDAAELSMLVR